MHPEKPDFESQPDPVLNIVIVTKMCENTNKKIFRNYILESIDQTNRSPHIFPPTNWKAGDVDQQEPNADQLESR